MTSSSEPLRHLLLRLAPVMELLLVAAVLAQAEPRVAKWRHSPVPVVSLELPFVPAVLPLAAVAVVAAETVAL